MTRVSNVVGHEMDRIILSNLLIQSILNQSVEIPDERYPCGAPSRAMSYC